MYLDTYYEKGMNMWLDISTACNAKCPQCHRTNPSGLKKFNWLPIIRWTFNEFKKAFPVKTLQHINRIEICGTWGDPLTNKHLYEITEYVMNESNTNILISTNGSFYDDIWWFKFGHLTGHRGEVFFAIEGTTQEMHSKYRINTNLNKILDNMSGFSEYGRSSVFTVVFKHNEQYLEDITKLVFDYGATNILFFPSNRFGKHSEFEFIDGQGNKKKLEAITNYNNPLYREQDYYKWINGLKACGKGKKDITLYDHEEKVELSMPDRATGTIHDSNGDDLVGLAIKKKEL
jgi:MoaA/NifB/PqqE/SkfB family radical SAM enzyme